MKCRFFFYGIITIPLSLFVNALNLNRFDELLMDFKEQRNSLGLCSEKFNLKS